MILKRNRVGISVTLAAVAAVILALALTESGRGDAGFTQTKRGLWTCGANAFQFKSLASPPGYERKDTPLAEAILRQLKRYPGLYAKHGWRLIFNNDQEAELIRGTPKNREPGWIIFEKEDGKWDWSGSGGCRLEPYRMGAAAGPWRPVEGQNPIATTKSLKVYVDGMQCAGGQPPGRRVMAPVIEYRRHSILVTYFVRNLKGVWTCPGSPPSVKTLKLKRPIGKRKLLDGSRYPYATRLSRSVRPG